MKPTHRVCENKKAFSLPEILVSIVLIASVILCFIAAFMVGKYAVRLSKERLIASNLLKKEMENILGTNYSSIDALAGSENIYIGDGLRAYPATRTIAVSTEDPALYGYKKIYAKIEWSGGIPGNTALREEMVMYATKQ